MEFEFSHNGTSCTVKMEKSEGAQKATIGGVEIEFAFSRISGNEYSFMFDGRSKTVYLAESNGAVFVHIDGRVSQLDKA